MSFLCLVLFLAAVASSASSSTSFRSSLLPAICYACNEFWVEHRRSKGEGVAVLGPPRCDLGLRYVT